LDYFYIFILYYFLLFTVKLQLEEKCRFHQSLELDWDVVGPPGRDWTPAMSPAEYVKRRALVLNYDKPLEISIGPSTFNFGTATDAPKPTVAPPTSSLTSGMHKRNSSTMNLDSSEQYTVLKENRFGFSQERILTVGKHPTPTLRVLDLVHL
jgi:hypothetical protein